MKIRIHADGRELSGTALQIVEQMNDLAFEQRSLPDYMDWLVEHVRRTEEIELNIIGDDLSVRAASLVSAVVAAGLALQLEP